MSCHTQTRRTNRAVKRAMAAVGLAAVFAFGAPVVSGVVAAEGGATSNVYGWINPGGGIWVNNHDGTASIDYPNGDRTTTSTDNVDHLQPVYTAPPPLPRDDAEMEQ